MHQLQHRPRLTHGDIRTTVSKLPLIYQYKCVSELGPSQTFLGRPHEARPSGRGCVNFSLVALPLLAADWPPIASEDLSMTSIPEIPGAPAVILQREETDDNMNNILIV
jgi:hypothetical protein